MGADLGRAEDAAGVRDQFAALLADRRPTANPADTIARPPSV
jgi:hypothetical protein